MGRQDVPDGVAICEGCGELYTEELTLSENCEYCEVEPPPLRSDGHDFIVCGIHGKVPFEAASDLGGDVVTLYCPECAKETRERDCKFPSRKEKTSWTK